MKTDTVHYIYILLDPRDYRIRYVGQTTNIKERYGRHCTTQRRRDHRANWLRLLRSLNMKPLLQIIEKCDVYSWARREVHWIKYYRELGCDLVNTSAGGEGVTGWVPNDEWKRKQRIAHTGNKYSLGVKYDEERKRRHIERVKGEGNPNAILSNKDVVEIKKMIADGNLTLTDIAKIYNVKMYVISKIKLGITWKHLHES